MGKTDYLDALKRAMTGLAPEAQAKTLAYYEQRFVDGVAAGRSEADVAAELDDPKKIAMTLRANAHMHAFEQKKNPANALRMLLSATGLAIFNLFMVVPAMVYAALLTCIYAIGLAFYVAGIAITASGLSGANELVLDGPFRHAIFDAGHDGAIDTSMQTKMSIGVNGIQVFQEKIPGARDVHEQIAPAVEAAVAAAEKATRIGAAAAAAAAGEVAALDGDAAEAARVAAEAAEAAEAAAEAAQEAADAAGRGKDVFRRAEEVAGRGIVISTDVDAGSRTTQTFVGLAMVLAGILVFLLSLVITKYTFIGIKRYVEMNFSLLKGS